MKLQVNHPNYSNGFCSMDQKYTMGIDWTNSFRTRVDRQGSVLGKPLFEIRYIEEALRFILLGIDRIERHF